MSSDVPEQTSPPGLGASPGNGLSRPLPQPGRVRKVLMQWVALVRFRVPETDTYKAVAALCAFIPLPALHVCSLPVESGLISSISFFTPDKKLN